MRKKHKKTSANAGIHHNFRAFTERWTLENMRFLEFTWIHYPRKYKKTRENSCERRNTLCFPEVNRAVNSGKQCVLLNLPAFAVLENKGKRRLSFVNPGEREVLHRENSSERRETRHLPSVNRTVNSRKHAFSGVHRYGKLPDNGTNTRIHRPQNTWKILDFPIGEYQKMSANTTFCANSPRVFKTVNAMFFAVS